MIEREREKYQRIWETPEYRQSPSPGDHLLSRLPVSSWLEMRDVKTVLDVGCGEGKLLSRIKRAIPHIEVLGMDIADNAIDPRLRDVFVQGCVWKESDYPESTDALFCIDVLEHLPTNKIQTVLNIFREKASKFVFVSICLKDDVWGSELIGEPLHLTVKNAFWWLDKINKGGFEIDFSLISEYLLDAKLV